MGHRTKEIREAVRVALERAGAIGLTLSTSGTSHQRFDFTVNGVKGRFVFASTPKSDRAIDNAKAVAKRTVQDYCTGRKGPRAPQGRSRPSEVPCGAWQ